MIGKLLAATAFALLAPTLAFAQTAGGMMASGYQMTATDALASKLIGSTVYSTQALSNGAAANTATTTTGTTQNGATAANANGTPANSANDTNAQQIGTIRDLVLGTDGKVSAVVIGIGGVLGLGEKNVAVGYADVKWAIATDGSIRGMLDTTADALKAAPDFQWPSNGQATKAGDANAANNNMAAGTTAATSNMAAANINPAATTTANDPQTFAKAAAPANLFEIQSSQLALKQGSADNVKQFAQKMIDDHGKAAQDMATAAETQNVTVPGALDNKGSQQLSQLQGLNGTAFDQAYIQMQVAAHDDAVSLFQTYAQSGPNGAMKDFAAKTLPTLQMHQQMIHQMAGK